jgi:ABC-type multidrug transport system permease subunit
MFSRLGGGVFTSNPRPNRDSVDMIAAIAASGLLNLLVQIVVAAVIFWILHYVINYINPPEPFKKVLMVILILVAAIFLINVLLGLVGRSFVTF